MNIKIILVDDSSHPIKKSRLQKCSALWSRVVPHGEGWYAVYLSELPLDAGLVLCYYLQTRLYKDLSLEWRNMRSCFSTALCVYSTAQEYSLNKLSDLARCEATRLGDRLALSWIIKVIEEKTPNLPEPEWVVSYVENRMRDLVAGGQADPSPHAQSPDVSDETANTRASSAEEAPLLEEPEIAEETPASKEPETAGPDSEQQEGLPKAAIRPVVESVFQSDDYESVPRSSNSSTLSADFLSDDDDMYSIISDTESQKQCALACGRLRFGGSFCPRCYEVVVRELGAGVAQ